MMKISRLFVSSEQVVRILMLIGRIIGSLLPRKSGSPFFFFFPYYQVGGAEKVHADITACVADHHPWVFFVYKSKDANFKHLFAKHGRLFNISSLVDNRYAYYICLAALGTFINRHDQATVFGSNNLFFYDLLPRLKESVRRIDLLHNFGGGIEHVSLPVVRQIDTRVICIRRTFSDLEAQYVSQGADLHLLDRVKLIELQVSVPETYPEKREDRLLEVIYVGRASEEKRVYLVGEAARRCHEAGVPAEFVFVGDVMSMIESQCHRSCIFKGEIADPKILDEVYDRADVLVLTSIYEGTSLVVMEAMAHGVVPVTTDVGGISSHVKSGINGILIGNGDEDGIVDTLVETIGRLSGDRALLGQMSRHAYQYARQHFAPSRFRRAYRQLLLQEIAPDCDEHKH